MKKVKVLTNEELYRKKVTVRTNGKAYAKFQRICKKELESSVSEMVRQYMDKVIKDFEKEGEA